MRKIYVHDERNKADHNWFAWILVIFLLISTSYFAWISLTIQADPVQRAYKQYNHLRLYEDGSYTGETLDGVEVSRCVTGGLCND